MVPLGMRFYDGREDRASAACPSIVSAHLSKSTFKVKKPPFLDQNLLFLDIVEGAKFGNTN